MDLPRLIMRRAALAALLVVLLGLALGAWRARADIEAEQDAAMALARLVARLGPLAQVDDAQALSDLRHLGGTEAGLRHVVLSVHNARGEPLVNPAATADDRTAHRVQWPLPRPQGDPWTLTLTASATGEQREAAADLLGTLALLALCAAGMLVAMHHQVRRALQPLGAMLDAIAGIERQDTRAVMALPTAPVRELETLATALRHLAASLADTETRRRGLAQQVQTLQEDERQRLARALHDETGQRLTALRYDLAWLRRQLADQPRLQPVMHDLTEHCTALHQDVRQMLLELRPLAGDHDAQQGWARLVSLLQSLVASWQQRPPFTDGVPTQFQLRLDAPAEPPAIDDARVLALYRLSQEALTNAARHSCADRVCLTLSVDARTGPTLTWQVRDNGIGLAGTATATLTPRGNGLAGMQERVWALGGEWSQGPADAANPTRPGLALQARLTLA